MAAVNSISRLWSQRKPPKYVSAGRPLSPRTTRTYRGRAPPQGRVVCVESRRLSAPEGAGFRRLVRLKHEAVAQQKIHQRTQDNRAKIRGDIVDPQSPYQHPHEAKVPS